MKCLKNLACAMLLSLAVVCAAEEVGYPSDKIVLNRQNQAQVTACIDALEIMSFTSPFAGQALNALNVQNLPEAIRLLGLAAADDDDQMGILSAVLGSVQGVIDDCKRGQDPDEGEVVNNEEIGRELHRRRQLLDAGYVVTDSGEVVAIAELNRRQQNQNQDM